VAAGLRRAAAEYSRWEPWRIGVLCSQTGVTAVIEESQLKGAILAIEEINAAGGVNGRELAPIIYDPRSEPANFARCAERLLAHDRVTSIFGCYTSSSRRAVLPIVERRNGLLWYPTLYEGFEYSPNIIYTGAAPNQNSLKLAEYLIDAYGPRFYFLGSDYIYPRESNRIMREFLDVRGGEVVAERYVDLRARQIDFRPVIQEIRQILPDVIFSTIVGQSTAYFYQAYADARFDPKTMPIASLTTSEAEIGDMGADVAENHLTAAPYFQSIRSPENDAFVAKYHGRFGESETTNMCAEAAYFQMLIFARALLLTNTMETDVLRPVILGSEFDAPQGRVVIDHETNHTRLWTRIGRINRQGQFDIVHESVQPAQPDPYLVCM
jgi:branched-chain amino acid transport system substrate-binding protein